MAKIDANTKYGALIALILQNAGLAITALLVDLSERRGKYMTAQRCWLRGFRW